MRDLNNTPSSNTSIPHKGLLSSDPNQAIQQMMETIDQLRSVYERETETLDNADTAGFFALQEKKMDIASTYQSSISELINRKNEIKAATPNLKEKLEKAQKEFSALSQRNLDALSRMSNCIERLGDTLRNAAKDSAKEQQAVSYTQDGKLGIDDRKILSTGVSETA